MAKNLCAAAVEEEAQNHGLPRYLISQLQPVPALPQEQRVELLPAAMPLASARQPSVVAMGSNPPMAPQHFLEAASGSFPALAFLFLFWLLSPSKLFCLSTTPFSFAIFSSHSLVLASGWKIFSISLEQQLIQAFLSVLALASPPLPHQILSFCCYPAILLTKPRHRFCCSTLPLPASLLGSDLVISWVSGKRFVASSTCLWPLWLWLPASVISSGSEMKRRSSRVGSLRIRRPIFPPCFLPARA